MRLFSDGEQSLFTVTLLKGSHTPGKFADGAEAWMHTTRRLIRPLGRVQLGDAKS